MDEIDIKLSRDCDIVADSAAEAVRWISDVAESSPVIERLSPSLIGELQRVRNQSRKLARAARRKMCVGVFGPSQAGKSYLVSILASREGRPLIAHFDGQAYDFLREINPPGGRESTGLVTRLTAEPSETPPGFPVTLRLLSQTDLVKIIGNSFFLDFDHQKAAFQRPDGEAIRRRLAELRPFAQAEPVDDLSEDDVLDLIEYFDVYFKGVTADFHVDFWREAIKLAPRLRAVDRGRLWSLLWFDYEPFTQLYRLLMDGLRKLAFADDAHCSMDALRVREKSIIDVLTLDRMGTDDADTVKVRPHKPGAPDVDLPRSLICALTAELRIAIGERPWPFFEHTDLLDFPGARSRLKLEKIEDAAKSKQIAEGANPLRELLLRGKVAYLFQRYSADRELSAMLLCIPDGVQEVRDLSDMVAGWVNATFGDTPQARARQRNGLYLVLTKMDREFEQKAGETDKDIPLRWTARLNNSLLTNFRGDWPRDWDGRPFDNTFWLRNPTVRDERLMLYEAGRETGVAPGFIPRSRVLRQAFVENTTVRQHFADPERAWDEAFRPNDGGLSYLVSLLTPVCDPAIKRAQVRGQLDEQLRRLTDRLSGFHSGSDSEARQKKQKVAQQVVMGLGPCVKQQRFGELLGVLQLRPEDLRSIYLRVASHRSGNGVKDDRQHRGAQAVGASIDLNNIFSDVFGTEQAAPATPAAARSTQNRLADRPQRYADEVFGHWLDRVSSLAGDERTAGHFSVTPQNLGLLIDELKVASNRLRLADFLAGEVRAVENAANTRWEDIAERQVRAASDAINRFVDWLGYDRIDRDKRPGLPMAAPTRRVFEDPPPVANGVPALGENPISPYNTFCADWLRAYLQLALDNVGYEGGRDITPDQNDRLGALLRRADMARAAA